MQVVLALVEPQLEPQLGRVARCLLGFLDQLLHLREMKYMLEVLLCCILLMLPHLS